MSLAFVVMLPVRAVVFALGLSLVVMTVRSAIRQFVLPRSAPDGLTRNVFLFTRSHFDFPAAEGEREGA